MPRCGVFVVTYIAVLCHLNTYFITACGPGLTSRSTLVYSYLEMWHSPNVLGLSLLTSLMTLNSLVMVYLWADFRDYRARYVLMAIGPYGFYVGSAIVLAFVQILYWEIAQIGPPPLIRLPLTTAR
jgi:hypothetical protein